MSSWQQTVNSGQYSSICAQESAYYICSPPQLSEVSSAFSLQSVQLMTAFSLLCKEAHQVIFLSFYICSPGDWWSHVLGFLPTSSVSSSLFDSIIASSRFPFFYSLINSYTAMDLKKGNCTWNFCHLGQCTILLPMFLVNSIIDAGCSLVTPQKACILQLMREGTVEQLKQLVPLHGEVCTWLYMMETHSVVHDVLQQKCIRYRNQT